MVDYVESASSVEDDDSLDYPLGEYELSISPNDFNVSTIFDFMKKGIIHIPGYQRNYVWDIRRASKLIESLIIGLPIPQIFLHEESKNRFSVIDGQQRLMTIYFFMNERFPHDSKRSELRTIFEKHGQIPEDILNDNLYFQDFKLKLTGIDDSQRNRFDGLKYSQLGEYQISFELRTIRHIIIKQIEPDNEHSAVFELFSRLNSGGVNLTPQEIRASMYHSDFYNMLNEVNHLPRWRELYGSADPETHFKDVEYLLRSFALLEMSTDYQAPMVKFLNRYSNHARQYNPQKIERLKTLFQSFLTACELLPNNAFHTEKKKFSPSIFEAVFVCVCERDSMNIGVVTLIDPDSLNQLKVNTEFQQTAMGGTAQKNNIIKRIALARSHIILLPRSS
ncbi:MAG: DUF262 domain-containing protein [Phototrophicaceae bacterium]